jgi:hypothetical protein
MTDTNLTKSQRAVWFRLYTASLTGVLAAADNIPETEILARCARLADAALDEMMKRSTGTNLGAFLGP